MSEFLKLVLGANQKLISSLAKTKYCSRSDGEGGSDNGQFAYPQGVAFDGAGHLIVVEQGNHRVQVLNYGDGSHARTIGSEGSGNGQFLHPRGGVAIDGNGRMILCDSDNHRVQVLQ
jgi:tripartite motif-containing protein 71